MVHPANPVPVVQALHATTMVAYPSAVPSQPIGEKDTNIADAPLSRVKYRHMACSPRASLKGALRHRSWAQCRSVVEMLLSSNESLTGSTPNLIVPMERRVNVYN